MTYCTWQFMVSLPARVVPENVFLHRHLLPPKWALCCGQLDILPRQPRGDHSWESGSTTWVIFSCETVHSRRWSRAEWLYWSQFSLSWSTYSTPSRLTLHRSHFHTTIINRNLRQKAGENAWDNFCFSKSNYKWWNMNQVLSKIQSNRGHTLNNAR